MVFNSEGVSVGHTQYSCNSPNLQLAFQLPACWNNPQMLIGHADWQGRPAQPHPLQQLPITLMLKSNTDEANYPVQTTDAADFFTTSVASLLQAPFYDWRAKAPKHLMMPTFGKSIGQPGYDDLAEFIGDGIVNIADFNLLKGNFGQGGASLNTPFRGGSKTRR